MPTGCGPGADSRFDTVESTEQWIWQKLGRACRDRRSAWRTPVLATVGADGTPRTRTVVLRGVDATGQQILLHSDARSGKMADLAAFPALALNFYDPRDQLQLRVAGLPSILVDGPAVDAAWDRVPARARLNYQTLAAPGSPSANEAPLMEGDGRANFAIIQIAIHRLEFLWLAPDRHRRGAVAWTGGGCARNWLVP